MGVWPGLDEQPEITHTARDWLAKLHLVAAGFGLTTVPAALAPAAPPGVRILPVRGGPQEQRRLLLAPLPTRPRSPSPASRPHSAPQPSTPPRTPRPRDETGPCATVLACSTAASTPLLPTPAPHPHVKPREPGKLPSAQLHTSPQARRPRHAHSPRHRQRVQHPCPWRRAHAPARRPTPVPGAAESDPHPKRLLGKVVVVTGAARGQGAAEAEALVREGTRVSATDVEPAEGCRHLDAGEGDLGGSRRQAQGGVRASAWAGEQPRHHLARPRRRCAHPGHVTRPRGQRHRPAARHPAPRPAHAARFLEGPAPRPNVTTPNWSSPPFTWPSPPAAAMSRACLPLRPRQRARVQEVVATLLVNEHRCSVSASAGVFQPRFSRTSTSGISYMVRRFGSEDKAVLQDRQPRLIGAFAPIEARRRAPVPRLAPSHPRATLRKRDGFPPQPS